MGSLKSRFGIRAKKKESPGAYWIKRRTSFPRGSVSGCGSMSISRSLGGCSEDEEGELKNEESSIRRCKTMSYNTEWSKSGILTNNKARKINYGSCGL